MIEPRAWEIEDGNGVAIARLARHIDINRVVAVKKTPLTTVADVLAALRQPSEAMLKAGSHQGSQRYYSDAEVKNIFLDMLDAFGKDQSSPAKKAYEAANPLGGPARMFEAIAERIRSGENYYAVLADYGVTVEEK